MKVAFFTEGGWQGTVSRDHPNMRVDLAWECTMGAMHFPLLRVLDGSIAPTGDPYDLGIIIVPKKHIKEYFRYDLMDIRDTGFCKEVAIMQEGPNWFWQDWDIPTQVDYIMALHRADFILCHSESDKKYYKGLLGREDVFILPTLILDDAVDSHNLTDPDDRDGVMIGGNLVGWYNGFDSYTIASEFDTDIYAPSMGRKQDTEELVDNINYLPYLQWRDWMTELSKRKYAVHLIRNRLAGTFPLNCAFLGIPCIGHKGTDTQEICHPKLSVELGDMEHARKLAKHLRDNKQFYAHCAAVARDNFDKHYSETIFTQKWNEIMRVRRDG